MNATGVFDHDPNAGMGENIWMGPGGDGALAQATRSFLDEKQIYHGGGFTRETGHYTQVL
jgi:hypothetical protein